VKATYDVAHVIFISSALNSMNAMVSRHRQFQKARYVFFKFYTSVQ